MDLRHYDGKLVRITDDRGGVFEGECVWFPAEYGEAELGRAVEGLEIDDTVFYADEISSVRQISEKPTLIWDGQRQHSMKLRPEPFVKVANGTKTIELRLWDEKRRLINIGDLIRFENADDDTEIVRVVVKDLHIFPSFRELYASLDLTKCGYTDEEKASASPDDMNEYYSHEQQLAHCVVGIEIAPYVW